MQQLDCHGNTQGARIDVAEAFNDGIYTEQEFSLHRAQCTPCLLAFQVDEVARILNDGKLAVFNMLGKSTNILGRGVFIKRAIDKQHWHIDGGKAAYILAVIKLENLVNVEHDLLLVALDHGQQILVIMQLE